MSISFIKGLAVLSMTVMVTVYALHAIISVPHGTRTCDYELHGVQCVIYDYAGYNGGNCPVDYVSGAEYMADARGTDCYYIGK